MALSSGKVCGSCDVQHITEAAIVWCTTCEEGLCRTCLGHHKINKASRKHETIPINQYASLETFSFSIKQVCEKHDQMIGFYCLDHEGTACGLCIPETHRQCTGLKPIDELVRHAKNSANILDIERGFEEIGKTLEKLQNNRKQNIDTIKDDKKTISIKIRALKERLTKRLDEMEANILKALDTKVSLNLSELDQLVSKIKEKEQSLEQTRKSIKQVKEGLSDVQVFLVTKSLKAKLCEEENLASKICQQDAARGCSLMLQINPQLEQLFSELNSYGEIQTVKRPCQIKVGAWDQKRAQLVVPTTAIRDIDKMQLKLEQKIQLQEGVYAGCIIVPGGRMVFALCEKNQISVYRKDGQNSTSIDVGRYPYDLAVITNNTVAVSCSDSESINIVNIDECVVTQNIDVNGTCHGLSYYKDKFYVLIQNKGIHEFDLDGYFVREIPVDISTEFGYLSMSNDKFVYSSNDVYNPDNRYIACCDFSGKEIWRSSSADSGVSFDQFGNCFAANFWSYSIEIISADGKREHQLLSSIDMIYAPEGVYFEKSSNTLLVIWSNWKAVLYRVI
ncbi:uncharacterized protein LOC127706090 [Mytilus californianus]|uniref:uncharacterized protein LOC127706090 n=1 Tax=Mytilus californianus TaxID=6549 RepID=UPI002246BF1E|nr:uncharacterized protein LOC127706090 [Mytilus californianus]